MSLFTDPHEKAFPKFLTPRASTQVVFGANTNNYDCGKSQTCPFMFAVTPAQVVRHRNGKKSNKL